MSLYTSFNIAQQALLMNQSAMNVVSSNISNMNTQGYSKQRLNPESSGYMEIAGGNKMFQVSAGAQIGDISRFRDQYLDDSYRNQNASLQYYNELYSMASTIENSVNELSGSGLQDAISQFFTAVQTLQATPADSTARVNYVQKAQVLCTQFNELAQTLTNNRTATVGNTTDLQSIYSTKLYGNITDLNNKLSQLGEINNKIVGCSLNNSAPNDLLDQRDKLLDDISQYIPISISMNKNNSVNLTMNGTTLVQGGDVSKFDVVNGTKTVAGVVVPDPDTPSIVQLRNSSGSLVVPNMNDQFGKGKIAAYLEMGGVASGKLTYQNMLDKVDTLAGQFAGVINGIQQYDDGAGTKAMGIVFDASNNPTLTNFPDASGNSQLPLIFTDGTNTVPPVIKAINIAVSSGVSSDPWKIAAARVSTLDGSGNPIVWDPKSVGNAENIKAMAKVRNQSILGLQNMNPEAYLTTTVSNMGAAIETMDFSQKSQSSLFTSANLQRQSAIGVNLDEELVDLVKYQKAYEASARIFSVASSLMDTIVNLGR